MINTIPNMGIISSGAIPSFPPSALGIWMPEYGPSVLNAAGSPAAHYDKVDKILDLSGNGRHAQQISDPSRLRYAKWEGENYWINNLSSSGAQIGYVAINDPTPTDFTFQMKLSLVSWASGTVQWLLYKGTSVPYYLFVYLETDGRISIQRAGAGGAVITSTVATGFAAHAIRHIRVAYVANTGSGNYSCIFSTSTDGVSWTQLGSTLTGASTGAMTPVAGNFIIGGKPAATQYAVGRIYSFRLVDDASATVRMNWSASNCTHLATSGDGATFTTETGALIGRSVLLGFNSGSSGPMRLASAIPVTNDYICASLIQGAQVGYSILYDNGGGFLGVQANSVDVYVACLNGWTQFKPATMGIRSAIVAECVTALPKILWRNSVNIAGFANSATPAAGSYRDIFFAPSGNGIFGRTGVWGLAGITKTNATTWLNT